MPFSADCEYRVEGPEVLYSVAESTIVDAGGIAELKQRASTNPRRRIRLCAHRNATDALHEMLIVHERDAYVRPHKHVGKPESMHIIEGAADLVVMDDDGVPRRVVQMGDYASGKAFYHRIDAAAYHTLLIRSDVLVFHETTSGPFRREETVFAPWAPDGNDTRAADDYRAALAKRIATLDDH